MSDRAARRRDEARARILQAAAGLQREVGSAGLSLREVARRADYSPAALYRYFDNRDALVAALADEADARLASRLADVSAEFPAPERLIRLGLAYLAFAHYEPESFGSLKTRPAMTAGIFDEAAAAGVAAGELRERRELDARAIADAVLALVHGLAAGAGSGDDRRDRAIVEAVVSAFVA